MHQTFLQRVFQPAGGWVYHRRALFNRALWKSFFTELELWLLKTIPPEGPLLLVGPSAGYNLTDRFLNQFSLLTANEIDPLSRCFWPLNHKTKVHEWRNQNYFFSLSPQGPVPNGGAFDQLFSSFPQHKILFCNLLGQLGYFSSLPTDITSRWKTSLQKAKTPWWSFHDLYSISGDVQPLVELLRRQRLERSALKTLLESHSGSISVVDHLTGGFIPEENSKSYFFWRMNKNSLHIIEATGHSI